MNTLLTPYHQSPSAAKALSPSPAKNPASPKKNTLDSEPFEMKFRETYHKSQESQKEEVKEEKSTEKASEQTSSAEEANAETSPTPSPEELNQNLTALFTVSVTENEQKQILSEENTENGNIFTLAENNADINIENRFSSIPEEVKSVHPEKIATTATSTPTKPVEDLSKNESTEFLVRPQSQDLKKSEQTSPVLESLQKSVQEIPRPMVDHDPTLLRPMHLDPPSISLKEFSLQAKSETISLGSKHHLDRILESVFEEKPVVAPRRIEIKLQTPHGAQVTLYLARVQQELRAQFSANNQQAFQWLQNEIMQLKSLSSGELVRWLPAQIDAGITKSQNSSKFNQEDSKDRSKKEESTSLDSIFDFFKPSTRRTV